MIDEKLLGWRQSPSGRSRIRITDGYYRYGCWQNGTVRLEPFGLRSVELDGLKRPNDAVVNDAGFAVVADWLSMGKPQCELFFVAPDGTVYRRFHFDEFVGPLAMEPDGLLVFASTAGSQSEEPKLLCFDIEAGKLRWSQSAPKPAAEITVACGGKCILVGRAYKSCGSDYLEKLTYDGTVIERWPDSPYQALEFGRMEVEAGRMPEAERWFRVAAESDIPPSYRAKAYRALGELAEDVGERTNALAFYEKAVALDPKVGLKRKIALLRCTAKK